MRTAPLAAANSPHLSYTNLSTSCQRAAGYAGESLLTLLRVQEGMQTSSAGILPLQGHSAEIPKMAVARLGGGAVTHNRHPPTSLGGPNQWKERFVRYPVLYLVHKISPVPATRSSFSTDSGALLSCIASFLPSPYCTPRCLREDTCLVILRHSGLSPYYPLWNLTT